MSKYGNRKTEVDGILFDSKKEAERWGELKLLLRAGEIKELKRQVKYCIIPTIEGDGGKAVQKATYYVCDFQYYEKVGSGWKLVVEDVKSVATKTAVYLLKKKLMRWRYGIEIKEV